MSVRGDVLDELLVFLRRPKPSPNLLLVAAGVVPHLSRSSLSLSNRHSEATPLSFTQANEVVPENRWSFSGAWL